MEGEIYYILEYIVIDPLPVYPVLSRVWTIHNNNDLETSIIQFDQMTYS